MYLYSSKNLTEKNSSDYRISEESPMEGNDDLERGMDNYTPNYEPIFTMSNVLRN